MKQRITPKELNKLTDAQKERLREWWKPAYGDFFSNGHWENIIQSAEDDSIRCVSTDNDGAYDYESKKECLPLLSIGQMIELLKTNEWNLEILELSGDFRVANDVPNGNAYSREELSDALWEACKSILKDGEGK